MSIEIDNDENIHCNKKASFVTPKVKTTRFGIEKIRWMGPIIWNFITEEMKNVQSLDMFKNQVKRLTFECTFKELDTMIRALALGVTFFL